ncbi:hypothetical protein BN2476_110149 [Paraburkholderia piptadeniae]|uniref:Uncharacterized protein n=1 Tax=Paraburkholderia piptadeniae TaxID=1701573 RepID=A0A1N7RPY6_9BURK|nr:hypothetical protein BN2476_110149 [Paraburkholderia piptadeniae]
MRIPQRGFDDPSLERAANVSQRRLQHQGRVTSDQSRRESRAMS